MPPATQTRKIIIAIDTKGAQQLKQVSDSLGGINKNTKDVANSLSALTTIGASFIGSLTIKQITSFADEIQNLNNKLLAMGDSQTQATATINALTQISRDTNQSLDAISQAYFRLSVSMRDANVSQKTLLDTTKTIANTFRLSGATADEATNATIQLGQAFSLGVLRGQDLRSVISQNLVLAKLIRKEFGPDYMKKAEAGLITVPKLMKILHDNMEAINESAKKMAPTFEQSLVKAFDAFKLKIAEISTSLGASGIFASGVQEVITNMGKLVTIMGIMSLTVLPGLIKQFYALATSMSAVSVGALAVTALISALVALNPAVTNNLSPLQQIDRALINANASIAQFFSTILQGLKYLNGPMGLYFVLDGIQGFFDKTYLASKKAVDDYDALAERLKNFRESGPSPTWGVKKPKDEFSQDMKNLDEYYRRQLTAKEQLKALNAQFLAGTISVADYNEKILDTQQSMEKWKFGDGAADLGKMNDVLRKFELFKINRQFREGAFDVDQFNSAVRAIKLANLKEDLEAGRISLNEFNSKFAEVADHFTVGGAFRAGLTDYLTAIGTTTNQVADTIKNAFVGLEDVFLQFTKSGKFNFDKMTQAILDDLLRIAIRAAVIQPLAGGLLNLFNSPAKGTTGVPVNPTGPPSPNAHGNAFRMGNVIPFASGGVVGGPTLFGMSGGRTGLMGEKGAEAILPLRRGSGGDLGVKASVTPVTVNVINQSGNEVKQTEKTGPSGEKILEVLITGKVREALGSGAFDKVMKQSYGVNRRGS